MSQRSSLRSVCLVVMVAVCAALPAQADAPVGHYTASMGMVTDNKTGLTWQQSEGPVLNWSDAKDYCTNLELNTMTDWRLPTVKELLTLVDFSKTDPSIDTSANACKQRCEEVTGLGRQLQPGVVAPGFGLPALIRDEQPLAAAEAQGVLNPDRAVAQRSAQGEQGGHLQCPERPLTVDVSDGLTPCRAQARCRDLARQALGAGSVQGAQPVQRIDRRMLARGLPRQAADGDEQRAHRGDGGDQLPADARGPARCPL